MSKKERVLSFGKYKGQEIKYIILTDIGYIVWCLENIKKLKLTDEEQAIYDAVAIRIRKSNWQWLMTFPIVLRITSGSLVKWMMKENGWEQTVNLMGGTTLTGSI